MQSTMQSPIHENRPIKLNRRGLTELVLFCALVSLSTYSYWSWQINGGHVAAMDSASTAAQGGIWLQILQQPAIVMSTVVAEFFLLLAITLALAPIPWWLHAEHIIGIDHAYSTTLLRWIGKKVTNGQNDTEDYNSEFVLNPEEDPTLIGQLVPGQVQPGQPVPGSNPPVTTQAHPLSPLPATVTEIKPGQAPVPPDGPPVPLGDLLNPEVPPEDDPLSDLANISDILNSAFDEDAGIDENQATLSRHIENYDIETIRSTSRQILATFLQ